MDDQPVETVQTLLAAAGVSPPPEEVERLAGLYPGLRKAIDRFHAVSVGDEVTAAVFRAEEANPVDGAVDEGPGERSDR